MKRVVFILAIFVSILLADLGTRYFWAHKIATTTTAIDSTFAKPWEQVTIYSDTLDIWFKAGAPDTSSWSSRSWLKLEAGTSIEFVAPVRLKRLEWKAVSGSGYLYIMGTKKWSQF